MSGTIKYTALEPEKRQIRLLTVELNENEEIACHLCVISLDDGLEYTALSYVWGTEEPTRRTCIWVNGDPFWIRPNLYNYLQLVATERTKGPGMFIDAICINQDDPMEITYQVGLMGSVYRGALEVTAWFGLEDQWTTDLLEKFPAIRDPAVLDVYLLTSPDGWFIRNDTWEQQIQDPLQDDARDIAVAMMQGLNNHPYWTRLWTVQEYLLPTRLTLRAGNVALERLQSSESGSRMSLYYHAGRKLHEINVEGEVLLPISTAIRLYGTQNCLRVRDHILGLLGLCKSRLIPDYEVSLDWLYARVLVEGLEEIAGQDTEFIQSQGRLDLLDVMQTADDQLGVFGTHRLDRVLQNTEQFLDSLPRSLSMDPGHPMILVINMIALGRAKFVLYSRDFDILNWYLVMFEETEKYQQFLQDAGIPRGLGTESTPYGFGHTGYSYTRAPRPDAESYIIAELEALVLDAGKSVFEASSTMPTSRQSP
ncbi:hypothetical protein LTR22_019296 [Elasticomyces elasticus]|nr:hypothetical protein LTR22_019296 [Elasticomyces elasticus]KAK4911536.1 hypothetical protein LTR49_019947 [Elasticomyces elasticus]KAK5751041.1 hypothetical protein LTS12_018851 [Elasticomyces elasticus]